MVRVGGVGGLRVSGREGFLGKLLRGWLCDLDLAVYFRRHAWSCASLPSSDFAPLPAATACVSVYIITLISLNQNPKPFMLNPYE